VIAKEFLFLKMLQEGGSYFTNAGIQPPKDYHGAFAKKVLMELLLFWAQNAA
jgi:hypothetical protein